ncbi:MAG TPA: hypothetical protein VFO65_02880 [Acidimicrobiales bacterium]|nr:hypothetical protein [Acidimicrobiales bacterium]
MGRRPTRRMYRALLHLYPRSFRDDYGDDLVALLDDLCAGAGTAAAWRRTAVDLLVTVPRYRMESVMSEHHSDTAVVVGLTLLVTGGVLGLLTGVPAGLVLLPLAAALAVVRRSALARSLRTTAGGRRHRRLVTAAVLGVVCLASAASYLVAVADPDVSGASLVLHNAVGVPTMVGALAFLVAGRLTPRTPATAR